MFTSTSLKSTNCFVIGDEVVAVSRRRVVQAVGGTDQGGPEKALVVRYRQVTTHGLMGCSLFPAQGVGHATGFVGSCIALEEAFVVHERGEARNYGLGSLFLAHCESAILQRHGWIRSLICQRRQGLITCIVETENIFLKCE